MEEENRNTPDPVAESPQTQRSKHRKSPLALPPNLLKEQDNADVLMATAEELAELTKGLDVPAPPPKLAIKDKIPKKVVNPIATAISQQESRLQETGEKQDEQDFSLSYPLHLPPHRIPLIPFMSTITSKICHLLKFTVNSFLKNPTAPRRPPHP